MPAKRLCDLPTGDKGQRFQVTANGYPNDGFNNIGFSDNETNASKMAETIVKAPGCKSARVIDRETGWPVATFFPAPNIRA